MSSGSPSAVSAPLRRGLISCLHSPGCRAGDAPTQKLSDDAPLLSDQDLPQAIYNLIVGFYEEAFDRLPYDTMPDLVSLINTGGFCLGLLDPVSNIILNTVALLTDDDAAAACPPAAKRSKRLARAALPRSNRGEHAWLELAIRSYYSLLDFIITYFGCLTMKQAIRYLYWAGADLLLAVMLIQHDLYEDAETQVLDPASARTQTALQWAADRAGHPVPNILAQVMAIQLQGDTFTLLKKQFAEDHSHLTSDNVGAIRRLLRCQISTPCDAQVNPGEEGVLLRVSRNLTDIVEHTVTSVVDVSSDGSMTTTTTTTTVHRAGERITSLRPIHDMVAKLSSCLTKASSHKQTLKSPCGDDCDYMRSLKMYLHGIIHNFYIKVLTLLPTPSGSLMRSILMAGHCYGSMDPVSNIIVNSIWYNSRGCPLPESERTKLEQYTDIFNPLSLLRPVVRSLEGLAQLALFADPQSSIACAMEKLSSTKCVTVEILSSARERSEKNPFHEAAMAARHPLPLQLSELHQQLLLMPDLLFELRSLMSQTSSSVLSIDHIASILDKVFISSTPRLGQVGLLPAQSPRLHAKALSLVSKKRSVYQSRRSFFRSKLEQLLHKYASQHFWEPKYTLEFICGVEESCRGAPTFHMCYRVNFMAASKLQLQKTLFFAEFWHSDDPKPNFCCPLPYPYPGRCYYDVDAARKIVYPNSTEYILCDITQSGTGNVGDMVEMDIVYFSFSSQKDVELAEKLNSYYAMQSEEAETWSLQKS